MRKKTSLGCLHLRCVSILRPAFLPPERFVEALNGNQDVDRVGLGLASSTLLLGKQFLRSHTSTWSACSDWRCRYVCVAYVILREKSIIKWETKKRSAVDEQKHLRMMPFPVYTVGSRKWSLPTLMPRHGHLNENDDRFRVTYARY